MKITEKVKKNLKETLLQDLRELESECGIPSSQKTFLDKQFPYALRMWEKAESEEDFWATFEYTID